MSSGDLIDWKNACEQWSDAYHRLDAKWLAAYNAMNRTWKRTAWSMLLSGLGMGVALAAIAVVTFK